MAVASAVRPRALGHVRARGARLHDARRRLARGQRGRRRGPGRRRRAPRLAGPRHRRAPRRDPAGNAPRAGSGRAHLRRHGHVPRRLLRPARRGAEPGARRLDGVSADRRRRARAQPVSGLHLAARGVRPALLRRRAGSAGSSGSWTAASCSRPSCSRSPIAPRPSTACRAAEADRFVALATQSFALSREPIDEGWYRDLERISAVAADIGGVASTHINHLTPRVLDIDELYARMQARGIAMIDAIQGPPRWDGPDVLLRQTSFRALAEPRAFRRADGSVHEASLRVRFGEVEARGIALTATGRALYDELTAEPADGRRWSERFPVTERALAAARPRLLRVRARRRSPPATAPARRPTSPACSTAAGSPPHPIVYEDFLPRSAAGIFQSNLDRRRLRTTAPRRARTSTPAGWPARSAASWPTRSRCTPPSASGRSTPSAARCTPTPTSPGADLDVHVTDHRRRSP